MSCNSQSPLAVQVKQSSGWSEIYSSITPRRVSAKASVCVLTLMPSATGVVQEAGIPRRPSISTKHKRQEPNGSNESVAHNLGTVTPASCAACMIEVPSGTTTSTPSIFSVTCFSLVFFGVP